MHFQLKTFNPPKPIEFWCNCCDAQKVHSEHLSTGRFFIQWGHVFKSTGIQDDYEPIVFALCLDCIGETETDND